MLQLAQEIESQALSAQREINIVKTAVAAKQRDIRMLELTSSEVKGLDKDTKVYQGVGKMCGSFQVDSKVRPLITPAGSFSVLW